MLIRTVSRHAVLHAPAPVSVAACSADSHATCFVRWYAVAPLPAFVPGVAVQVPAHCRSRGPASRRARDRRPDSARVPAAAFPGRRAMRPAAADSPCRVRPRRYSVPSGELPREGLLHAPLREFLPAPLPTFVEHARANRQLLLADVEFAPRLRLDVVRARLPV